MTPGEQIQALFERWQALFQSATPSFAPIFAAMGLTFFITLFLLGWNVKALLAYARLMKDKTPASTLAWGGWIVSGLGPFMGPLLLPAGLSGFVMGAVAWRRLKRLQDSSTPGQRMMDARHPVRRVSIVKSRIPAKMAMINGLGTFVGLVVLVGGIYFAFGSILREILFEFWQNRGVFQDYIVT